MAYNHPLAMRLEIRDNIRRNREIQKEIEEMIKSSSVLDQKGRKILKWRWVLNKALEETGREFGVSRERIRQLEHKYAQRLAEESKEKAS